MIHSFFISLCFHTARMDGNNTALCFLKLQLKIFRPSAKTPFARTIDRKILIRFKSYRSTDIHNVRVIFLDEREETTRQNHWSDRIEPKSMFGVFPVESTYILTVTVSCAINKERKIVIFCLKNLNRGEKLGLVRQVGFDPVDAIIRL